MEGNISLRSPPTRSRRQPLYRPSNHRTRNIGGGSSHRRSRMGETTGECAAVCCCCPCAVVHFFLLAAYRLPRSLWRIKKKKKNLLRNSSEESEMNQREMNSSIGGEGCSFENDAVAWEDEMWDGFYGSGFWRSASRRND